MYFWPFALWRLENQLMPGGFSPFPSNWFSWPFYSHCGVTACLKGIVLFGLLLVTSFLALLTFAFVYPPISLIDMFVKLFAIRGEFLRVIVGIGAIAFILSWIYFLQNMLGLLISKIRLYRFFNPNWTKVVLTLLLVTVASSWKIVALSIGPEPPDYRMGFPFQYYYKMHDVGAPVINYYLLVLNTIFLYLLSCGMNKLAETIIQKFKK